MSRSYLTSCPSANTDFRQNTTPKKRTNKSRKHLLQLAILNFFVRTWQIPLAVTNFTWLVNLTSWLDKLTCHPLFPHHFFVFFCLDSTASAQINWQVIPCQVDLSSQFEPSSYSYYRIYTNTWHMRSTGVRMAGRLGIHEGWQGAWGKKDAGMDFGGGVKHWDKCKLRTALEWVVFTSSRTARLELTKVLDAGKDWKWFQFGLEGNRRIDLWS